MNPTLLSRRAALKGTTAGFGYLAFGVTVTGSCVS